VKPIQHFIGLKGRVAIRDISLHFGLLQRGQHRGRYSTRFVEAHEATDHFASLAVQSNRSRFSRSREFQN